MLSKRLRAVYERVPPGGVADIGTDHGYLASALAQDGQHDPVIATDIAQVPLEKSRAFARSQGLQNKIDFRLGDGLCVLRKGEVKTAVIAGLGGESTAAIIRSNRDIARDLLLVLQPMSRPDILRRALFEEGYAITAERFVRENGRIFCVITAREGNMPPLDRARELVGLLTAGDPLFSAYLEWVIGFTEKAARGAAHAKDSEEYEKEENFNAVLGSLYAMRGEIDK